MKRAAKRPASSRISACKSMIGNLIVFSLALTGVAVPAGQAFAVADGVSDEVIRIGGVMDLKGRSRGLGQGMKAGITAAIRGERVQGRRIEFVTLDDSYTPSKTIESTNLIIARGVFVVIGNVGTPTAKVSLPILAEHKVPAVGFFTGAGILRPGVGDIVNYRASYVQETAAVIDAAIKAGVSPTEICAYVQNDAYGMAGVIGIRRALQGRPGTEEAVAKLDEVLAQQGENPPRNDIGPVGVYQRNTFVSRDGYQSLKNWEQHAKTECKIVVTVGTYNAIARFAAYARYKGEDWVISAVSFTGADDFRAILKDLNIVDRVIMTQVVPSLDSDLPIVKEAREKLGEQFGYVSLEGFIVGKMWLKFMRDIKGPITRESFLKAVRNSRFDLGGIHLDFSKGNQGSDSVLLTYLSDGKYKAMKGEDWRVLLQPGTKNKLAKVR